MKNNKTCFKFHQDNNILCDINSCRNWIDCKKYNNCVLIAANDGPKTLESIGQIFNVTRMRICQIEKNILKKLGLFLNNENKNRFQIK
jgi:hypothetical protein